MPQCLFFSNSWRGSSIAFYCRVVFNTCAKIIQLQVVYTCVQLWRYQLKHGITVRKREIVRGEAECYFRLHNYAYQNSLKDLQQRKKMEISMIDLHVTFIERQLYFIGARHKGSLFSRAAFIGGRHLLE